MADKKPAISKSTLVGLGGLLVIGGVIFASEMGGRERERETVGRDAPPSSDPIRESGRKRVPRGGDAPSGAPSSGRGRPCPTPTTVEDASLKANPEFVKTRFAKSTCSETPAGVVNSCLDADPAACEQRLENLKRMVREPGRCVARPAELFCSTNVTSAESTMSFCFQAKDKCEEYRRGRIGHSGICRIATECERVTLPPL